MAEQSPDEIATLKRNMRTQRQKPLERVSPIAAATMMIDEDGILLVESRMDKADCISYETNVYYVPSQA